MLSKMTNDEQEAEKLLMRANSWRLKESVGTVRGAIGFLRPSVGWPTANHWVTQKAKKERQALIPEAGSACSAKRRACQRNANLASVKRGPTLLPMARIGRARRTCQREAVRCYFEVLHFCPYLSMPSRRIFDSSVWRGIPSFAAAPEGPDIRPWVSARTASIISTSRSSNAESPRFGEDSADSVVSQLSSTTKVSVSLRMTARSTTFCNSRILPGQW